MAKIKLTKTELKAQTDALKRFQRFLPMLQLKKQQLQGEIAGIIAQADAVTAREKAVRAGLDAWVGLFATGGDLLDGLVAVKEVRMSKANIAGVEIPVFDGIETDVKSVDLWETPAWIDDAVAALTSVLALQCERAVLQRQRELILNAAWGLFRERGYKNVTLEDILQSAACSKGRFYYYFHAKAELLDTLYEAFDRQYEAIAAAIDPACPAPEKILLIHRQILEYLSERVGADLLTNLYLSQLEKNTHIDFWGDTRSYACILRRIVAEGQRAGQMSAEVPCEEVVQDIISLERGQLIDWCLKEGAYSLPAVGVRRMQRCLTGYLA